MAKNFQVVLDFMVNLKTDKSKVEKLAKEIETILSKVSPDLDFDSPELKNSIKQIVQFLLEAEEGAKDLQKVLTALQINLDTEEAKKALSDIQSFLDDIDKTDLTEVEKAFNELGKENIDENIQNLDKALKEIDATKFNKEVEKLADSFLKARQETEQLVSKQKLALQALKSSGQEGSEAYKKLEKEIEITEKKLKTLGISATETGKSFTEKMANFGLAVQGVQQITGAFEKFLVPYQEFDKQLRNIGTLGVKNFEEFRDAAIDIATKVPDTVAGVTEGIYNAISAGAIKVVDGVADIEGGIKFVEQASKLAVAGLTDTNSAIKSLAANLNAYGESTEQAERYSDILFNTVNNGVTTIPELNASLSNVIPTAASFGVAFEQVTAAIATMTQQGVPTAQATTQIRAALVELAKPGAELSKIMQKANVSLESLQKEGLQITMKKLGEVMEEAGLKANQVFSSVEAASAALALSGKNAEKFANILQTYTTDAIGSTQRAFDIANEGIGVKVQGILNQIEASFFKFFNVVGDGFTTVLSVSNQIAPVVMSFGQLGNLLPIDKIKGQIASISTSFVSLIKNADATGGILKGLSIKMQESGGILAKLGPAITNPWVLGIGAALAGLTLYLTQTEKGKQILERWGEAAKELWNKAQPVINAFLDAGEEFINYLIKIGEFVYEMLITPTEIAISIISEIVNAIYDLVGVSNESSNAFQNLREVLKLIGKYFETAANGVQILIYSIRVAKDFVIGFIESIPELFSVLMDYANYYLNPVNWISGDEEYEQELSNRLTNAVTGAMNKAKNTIAESKLDFAIQNAMTIKEELDKNKKIDELVKKYENAKSEIEKKSIAEEIAKQVPNAVNGYKQLIDENGKVVQAIDLNIEKVKEFTKANEETYSSKLKSEQNTFIEALKEKAGLYEQLSKQAETLANKIVEGSKKGDDVLEIKAKYQKIKKELQSQANEMTKILVKGTEIGIEENKVYEQIAKSFGISVKEAKNLVTVQKESKSVGESQVKVVDKLAEAWSAATNEIDNNIKKQLSAINEISKRLSKRELSKEERKELQEQYNEELRSLKENVKEKKNLERIDELNQIRAGLRTKEGKSVFELAKQEAELKIKNLDIEQKNYEYVQKQILLQENRKADSYDELLINQKKLDTIKNQRLAWIEALKAKKMISEVTDEGEVIFTPKVKEIDKTEIQSIIQDFNIKVQEEQSRILELKIKLKADDIALQDKLIELEKKKVEWEISIGIKEETALKTYIDEYKNKLFITRNEIESNNNVILKLNKELENELSKVSGANAEQEIERIKIRYELKIKEAKEKNLELMQNEFETQQKIKEIEDRIYKARIDSIKRSEEKKLEEIENRYKKETEILNKFNEIYSKATDKSISQEKNEELKKIEDTEKAKLAELEKWRNMNTISAEEYERKKAEIEEMSRKEREQKEDEFRRKQLRAQSQMQGLEIELQRRKDNETLSIQKDALKKQLKLLEEKANKFDIYGNLIFDSQKEQEEYNALKEKLLETEKMISERGDSIGLVVTELQTTVTESISNLFAGDPEAAADSWRKFFSQLAGMLQAKASAFILDLVLSPGTMQYLSTMPFPTNVVAIPVITAAINAAVKAITDPIISSILSFSTGGRIDQPTMAIIGDGSRLGGRNREWIFTDSQLIATVQMAGVNSNSMLIAKLDRLEKLLASQELTTTLKGRDIDIALRRTIHINNLRAR